MVPRERLFQNLFLVIGLMLALLVPASIASANGYTVVHNFNRRDGASPFAGLTPDGIGNFYGTTCGTDCQGTPGKHCSKGCSYGDVFSLGGTTVTVIHAFRGGSDGAEPDGPVIFFKGDLYGTTLEGGSAGSGTVFKIP